MLSIIMAVIFTAVAGLAFIGLHITVLMGAYLGFIIVWEVFKREGEGDGHAIIGGIIGGIVGIIVFALIAVMIGTFAPAHYALEEKIELASFKDASGAKGGFFLGSGSIGSEIQYFYYKKVGNGFAAGKLSAGNVVIYEEDNRSDGVILKYRERFTLSGWYKYFAFSSLGNVKYEVFVPKGSILTGYRLDLE